MTEAFDIIIRALLTACGTGFLTLIVFMIKWIIQLAKRDRMTLDALSHNAYFKDCKILLPKDEITKEELENHDYLYKTYHARGLNGTGDRLHEIIMDKPVKTD